MIPVSNAGPLISLARVGRLDLLPALFEAVLIPPAVRREVIELGAELPGARELEEAPWLRTVEVSDRVAVDLLGEQLGPGESEAIILALERRALLLIDELRGRRIADSRGLHVAGTVGLLATAKALGLLPAVAPLLEALRASGFRMSPQLRERILRKAGEPT